MSISRDPRYREAELVLNRIKRLDHAMRLLRGVYDEDDPVFRDLGEARCDALNAGRDAGLLDADGQCFYASLREWWDDNYGDAA